MLKALRSYGVSYGFCFAILQLLIACGPAADENLPKVPDEVVAEASAVEASAESEILILAFGDSLYAGYGLPQNEGFVPELQKSLKANGQNVKVHNAGVSGDTTAAGLRRMDFVLDSLTKKPDLVLLGLGGNDVLRGLNPNDSQKNMEAMIKKLSQRDIPILLTGMVAPANLGKSYGDQFNGIYAALAKKYDAALYPFFMDGLVGKPDLILADGIHPNEQGIDLIVGNITPAVISALGN